MHTICTLVNVLFGIYTCNMYKLKNSIHQIYNLLFCSGQAFFTSIRSLGSFQLTRRPSLVVEKSSMAGLWFNP